MEKTLFNVKGEEIGKVALPEKVFGAKPQPTLLHEITTIYQSNQRSGTAHVKTRAEVSGGGKKPWKQKGTGRARHGSIRSPIWRGGGVAWGPRHHSYRLDLPKRKARLALVQALSARANDDGLRIVDSFQLDGGKTKQVVQLLKALKADKKSLIVAEQHDAVLARASRNIPGLIIRLASDLNAYEVLASRNVIIAKGALEKLAPKLN